MGLSTKSAGQKSRYRNAIVNTAHVCEWCEKTFKPKRSDRTRYCSRACGFEGERVRKAEEKRQREATRKPREPITRQCAHCRGSFVSKHAASFCSTDCRTEYHRETGRQRYYAEREAELAAREPIPCAHCAEPFVSMAGAIYCGPRCARRVQGKNHRERARRYGVHYEPVNSIKVFERDGWKCQECKRITPRNKRGTMSPSAPELDHIIPLSKGGAHSYRNTQCLCRSCNGRKANGPGGQMRLFG